MELLVAAPGTNVLLRAPVDPDDEEGSGHEMALELLEAIHRNLIEEGKGGYSKSLAFLRKAADKAQGGSYTTAI